MQITGAMLYRAFHDAMPHAGPRPTWEQLTDWQREIWDRAAHLLMEDLACR